MKVPVEPDDVYPGRKAGLVISDNRSSTPDYRVEVVWGQFVRRLNRFSAEVVIGEEAIVPVHIPSSGRMAELLVPGAEIGLLYRSSSRRKTRYTAAFVAHESTLVSIDSHLPNRLVGLWLRQGRIKELAPVQAVTAEVGFGSSRFDFLVSTRDGDCLVEVKSVTLVENGVARFPDAPTDRGARHVRELVEAKQAGLMGCILFVVQRDDARLFTPNSVTDPGFAAAVREAAAAGISVYAYRCRVRRKGHHVEMELAGTIPVEISQKT